MNSIGNQVINSHKKVEGYRSAHRQKMKLARKNRERKLSFVFYTVFILLLAVGISQLPALGRSAAQKELARIQEKYEVKEFSIISGDTAWEIQKDFLPGENMEKLMFHLQNVNGGQKPSTLRDGQTYKFFVEKEGN